MPQTTLQSKSESEQATVPSPAMSVDEVESNTRFTGGGALPPVAASDDVAVASASERAFGEAEGNDAVPSRTRHLGIQPLAPQTSIRPQPRPAAPFESPVPKARPEQLTSAVTHSPRPPRRPEQLQDSPELGNVDAGGVETAASPSPELGNGEAAPSVPVAIEGTRGNIVIHVIGNTTRGAMDLAGIDAAEQVLRANPELAWVELQVQGMENGVRWTTNGGWTRRSMEAGTRNGGALAAGPVPPYASGPLPTPSR